jgi:hypothetical protein
LSLPGTLEASKNDNSAEILQSPKTSPKFMFDQSLSTRGKLLEKLILRTIQKHAEERSQFGFRADPNMKLQHMSLAVHTTLNFNNNMSTTAVFLDIEKACDTTWHSGPLHKLSELLYIIREDCWFIK